jgi:hypothetical protein
MGAAANHDMLMLRMTQAVFATFRVVYEEGEEGAHANEELLRCRACVLCCDCARLR